MRTEPGSWGLIFSTIACTASNTVRVADAVHAMGLDLLPHRVHGVGDSHRVRTRLAVDREHDRAAAVEPAGDVRVLNAVPHLAQVAERHRRAIDVLDDEVTA